MINSLWCKLKDDPTNVANRAVAGNIKYLLVEAGTWDTGNSIKSYGNPSSWINTVKAINPNLKVLAWLLYDVTVDLTSESAINTAANNAVNFTINNGYDGLQDDYEKKTGSDAQYQTFINSIYAKLHAQNKLTTTAAPVYGKNLSTLYNGIKIDYVMPMCYDSNNWTGQEICSYLNTLCQVSASPILCGIMIHTDSGANRVDPATMLAGIDTNLQATSKLVGFSCWMYTTMTASDWTVWNNWKTKNGTETGGETTANITFSGTVKDTATNNGLNSASITIMVTQPNSVIDTLTATTNSSGNFTVTKTYSTTGSYSAKATAKLSGYNDASSDTVPFTIQAVNGNMTVTLNVAVA